MKISEVMTRSPRACRDTDTLDCAAQVMWEQDCGFVPVLNEKGVVVGTVTDRDLCMAVWTQGKLLRQLQLAQVASHPVFTVNETDSIEAAELLMLRKQIRRLPVLDVEGKVVGVLSLSDLARRLDGFGPNSRPGGISRESVAQTLAGICRPHAGAVPVAHGVAGPLPPPGASPPLRRKPAASSH